MFELNIRATKQINSLVKQSDVAISLVTVVNRGLSTIDKKVRTVALVDDSRANTSGKKRLDDNVVKHLNTTLEELNPDVIHLHAPYSTPFANIPILRKFRFLLDIYDPIYFYSRARLFNYREISSERWLMENSVGFSTKFPEELYLEYSRSGYAIDGKPYLMFADYCAPQYFSNKDKIVDPYTLIYCGACDHAIVPKYFAGNNQFQEIFKSILMENLNLEVYGSIFSGNQTSKLMNFEYYRLKNKYPSNFNLNGFVKQRDIQTRISKAGFGLQIHDFSRTGHHKIFGETSFGNKLFSYLEGGTPILVNEELTWNARWVQEYNLGITFSLTKKVNIRALIDKIDYQELQKNINSLRSNELSMDLNIKNLINFYHRISE